MVERYAQPRLGVGELGVVTRGLDRDDGLLERFALRRELPGDEMEDRAALRQARAAIHGGHPLSPLADRDLTTSLRAPIREQHSDLVEQACSRWIEAGLAGRGKHG